jgi:hypothetical protein
MENRILVNLIKNNNINELELYINKHNIKITSKHLFEVERNNLDMVKFLCKQGSKIDEFVFGFDVSYTVYVLSNYESYYNIDLINYILNYGNINVTFGEDNSLDIIDVLELVFYKDAYYNKKIDYNQVVIVIRHIIDQLKVRIFFDPYFKAKITNFFERINDSKLVKYVDCIIEQFKEQKYIQEKKCKKIINRQPKIIFKPNSLSYTIISIIWELKMGSKEEVFTNLLFQKSSILNYFGIVDLDKFTQIFLCRLSFQDIFYQNHPVIVG